MSNICPCTMGNSISKALFGLRDAKKLNCDTPEQSAAAVVLSRKVQRSNEIKNFQESPWQYLVTFRLDDGQELMLHTTEEQYITLKEDSRWQVTWQDTTLKAAEQN